MNSAAHTKTSFASSIVIQSRMYGAVAGTDQQVDLSSAVTLMQITALNERARMYVLAARRGTRRD